MDSNISDGRQAQMDRYEQRQAQISSQREKLEAYREMLIGSNEKEVASASLDTSDLESLDASMERRIEEPAKVKTLGSKPFISLGMNRQGFIDALVFGFLTAIAGLTSFLYMLLSINGILY